MGQIKKIVILGVNCRSLVSFRGPLLKLWIDSEYIVTAVAPDADEQVIEALASLGVSFHQIPFQRTQMNPFSDLNFLYRLFRFLSKETPDAVFAYGIKPVLHMCIAASILGVSKQYVLVCGAGQVFAERSIGWRQWVFFGVHKIYKQILKNVSVVFFQNPDDIVTFKSLNLMGPNTRSVLVNGSGVDLNYFAVEPILYPPIRFILIGRLIQEKGLYYYIEAARKLHGLYGDRVRCAILGPTDNYQGAFSVSELEALESDGILSYLGEVRDVRPYIAEASVFVLPSYYMEGIPRSILEAMGMGRPIITTQHRGCKETVEEGVNGYLVPCCDSLALAEAMIRFVENPEIISVMGQASRALAVSKFDADEVAKVMLEAMETDWSC